MPVPAQALRASLPFLFALPCAAQEPRPASALLDRLVEIPRGATVHQFSSHNREGWNGDDGWHLYRDRRGDAVIFDVEGPGCVRSIWATDIREDTTLHFYFDGEEEPRFTIPMLAFFQGRHPLFPAPLVSYERRGHWGERPFAGNCFVPIPFARGLRISASGELHFYHVLWESYPHGTEVSTFTGEEDRSALLDAFAGGPRAWAGAERVQAASDALGAGEELVVADLRGPGCVRELVLEAPASEALLRDAWIRMAWDDPAREDVHAPVGYFFGTAVRPAELRSLPLTAALLPGDRVRLTCRFPMPFRRTGRIFLTNRSGAALGPVRAAVAWTRGAPPEDRITRFTTLFREGWTTYGRDWLVAETAGTGWYAGTIQTMLGEHYCEGDEHFALDQAVSPQIHGTGSEDYFLACFWPSRIFHSPFACCVNDIQEEGGSMQAAYGLRACYGRFHLEAPIPFYARLDARIQHGGFDQIRSDYGSLSFYYLRRRPALRETDYLDVGNAASEAAHDYRAAGEPLGPRPLRSEGREMFIERTEDGRRHEGGEIRFRVAIAPDNDGVRLRRRLDQASPRQTADVFLDGELAGTWYHADHNPTLRCFDSDFDIHPRFTRGKKALEVRIVPRVGDGRGAFTDLAYRAYSFESAPAEATRQEDDGADAQPEETRPPLAYYFDWVNRNWWGSSEEKILANLGFFRWLREAFGMQIDLYLLDATTLDNGPNCLPVEGRETYGDLDAPWFHAEYPRGLAPIAAAARSFGCDLGMWMGPDGFGDTPTTAAARTELLVRLVRDLGVRLFKLDACCSGLPAEKTGLFVEAIRRCRAVAPDLLVSNHRVGLEPEAEELTDVALWEGQETYVDVFVFNPAPAPHHRAGVLFRPTPPGLTRSLEDHGVCLSSCLDGWDDDLVLQAFQRSLLLAPEIYGNPWLLRDDEFPRMARLFNLHRRHRDLLVRGRLLPASRYGSEAVSRGDGDTRLLVLRNPGWESVRRTVRLGPEIGLAGGGEVELRQYHPVERVFGVFPWDAEVQVEVEPWRTCLLKATREAGAEFAIVGCDYQVEKDLGRGPVEITLLGRPGERANIRLQEGGRRFGSALLDGRPAVELVAGGTVEVAFPGDEAAFDRPGLLAELTPCPVPADAEALYEASCFAGDSNALEVRSLERAGPTRHEAVQDARSAFFDAPRFVEQGIWDRFLFDGDPQTAFRTWLSDYTHGRVPAGALRVDLAEPQKLDRFELIGLPADYAAARARVGHSLRSLHPARVEASGDALRIADPRGGAWRYLVLEPAPARAAEAVGWRGGRRLPTGKWRASNLLPAWPANPARTAWTATVTLDHPAPGMKLVVGIPGDYGANNAWAVLRMGGELRGAPDRAPSYPYNPWEHYGRESGNYSYDFPVDAAMAGRPIEVVALGCGEDMDEVQPWVRLVEWPRRREALRLVLR